VKQFRDNRPIIFFKNIFKLGHITYIMKFLDKKTIKLDKVLNKLDKFVLDFIEILKKHSDYVIVSGYVSILFGRSRATEDIDLLIPKITEQLFFAFFKEISKKFYCLNSSKPEELYEEYLLNNNAIRFAYKNKVIPNIEFKFAKTSIDFEALKEKLIVKIGDKELFISPLELQISFKKYVLSSDKDLEDAEHLINVFKENLNPLLLKKYKRLFENE